MIYITVKQSPMYRQMSFEDFLFGDAQITPLFVSNITNTRTYVREQLSEDMRKKLEKMYGISTTGMIRKLVQFNNSVEELRKKPRKELYREFYIPKSSGGLRKIDAPNEDLMLALRNLKSIFENDFHCLYHTSAFAYVKGRSTIDAVKRHQANESKWFAKFDLSNFFGSTTLEFVMRMFSMIYPFSEIINDEIGRKELEKALDLAFLDGGLPQGTPISPTITNIMMIPVDYTITKQLRGLNDGMEYNKQDGKRKDSPQQTFVYTRYADDFLISSKYDFRVKQMENYICKVLADFEAPFSIKHQKTRYGSSAGSNWNLGVMLNKDNQITVGHKKKRQFQSMMHSFIMDTLNGNPWSQNDIQVMAGYYSYYRMVEEAAIDGIIRHINEKHHVDVMRMIKEQLNTYVSIRRWHYEQTE